MDIIKKYDSSISYWKSESDEGIYDAMNKGIEASKGDWLYFIGADDTLCEGAIKSVLPYLNQSDEPLMIYGNIYNVKDQKETGQSYNFENLSKPGQRIAHQSIFYHNRLFKAIGGYQTQYKIVADHVFNLHCFARFESKTLYINERISNYSGTGASSHNVVDLNYYNNFNTILAELNPHLQANTKKKSLIEQNFLLLIAERNILLGNYLKGMITALFFSAKRLDPIILLVALGKLKRRVFKQMTIV